MYFRVVRNALRAFQVSSVLVRFTPRDDGRAWVYAVDAVEDPDALGPEARLGRGAIGKTTECQVAGVPVRAGVEAAHVLSGGAP